MKWFVTLLLVASCAHKQESAPVEKQEAPATPQKQTKIADNACGISGPLTERIADCGVEREHFVLVMRSGRDEVYKDTKSGLLWGPRLRYETNFYGAGKVCGEMELAQIDNGIQWRLPSIDEYREAHIHGIDKAFSDMDHWFWTSTFRGRKLRRFTPIQMWKGMDGEPGQNFAEEAASVRCLGRARN